MHDFSALDLLLSVTKLRVGLLLPSPSRQKSATARYFARAYFGTALFNNNIYEFVIFIFP